MKTIKFRAGISLALLTWFLSPTLHAAFHTWTGAVSGYWSNTNNWSGGSAPEIFETSVEIDFPSGTGRLHTTNDIGFSLLGGLYGLEVDSIIVGDNYTFSGSYIGTNIWLTGNPASFFGFPLPNLDCAATNLNIVFDASLNLILQATNAVSVPQGTGLNLQSTLSGIGGLTLSGPGITYFDGPNSNSFTGTLDITGGSVYLNNFQPNYNSIDYGLYADMDMAALGGGPIVVGVPNGATNAELYVERNSQFPDSTAVTLYGGGGMVVDRSTVPASIWQNPLKENAAGISTNYIGYTDGSLVCGMGSLNLYGGSLYVGKELGIEVYWETEYQELGYFYMTNLAEVYVTGNVMAAPSAGTGAQSYVLGTGHFDIGGTTTVTSGALLMSVDVDGITKLGSGLVAIYGGDVDDVTIEQGEVDLDSSTAGLGGLLTVTNGGELHIYANCTNSPDPINFSGHGISGSSAALIVSNASALFYTAGINFAGDTTFDVVNENDQLAFEQVAQGVVSGTNNLFETGAGQLQFLDYYQNIIQPSSITTIFTGTLFIENGSVLLNSAYVGNEAGWDTNGIALNGPIVIGPSNTTSSCYLELGSNGQLATNVSVTVNSGAQLEMDDNSQSFGSLTLNGGIVYYGDFLTLLGNITTVPGSGASTLFDCDISLGGANRTFTVGANSTLQVYLGAISDGGNNAGVTKAGTGILSYYECPNSYGGSTYINAGLFTLGGGALPGSGTGSTLIASNAEIDLQGSEAVGVEPLSLAGAGTDGLGVFKGSGPNSWAGPVTLNGTNTFDIATNSLVALSGVISSAGACSLIETGPGTLEFNGSSANTYAGPTTVLQGTLLLSKTNATAIPGSLVVGGNPGSITNATVRLFRSNQTTGTTALTLNSSGGLDLNSFFDTVGPISINDSGYISTGTGLLTMNGDITADYTVTYLPVISGNLSLGGVNRNIICSGSPFEITANITDGGNNAGFTNSGVQDLYLYGSNSFNGVVTIQNGFLVAGAPYALGSTVGGTLVNPGSTLELYGNINVGAEPLTVSGAGAYSVGALYTYGTNSWAGPITLAAASLLTVENQTTLSGLIGGPGALTLNGGVLKLAGTQPNTYGGQTTVTAGTLELSGTNGPAVPGNLVLNPASGTATNTVLWLSTNQVSLLATITSNPNTLVNVNGFSDTIGALSGPGTLNLGQGSLTCGSNNLSTIFSGPVLGGNNAFLNKIGSGALTLSGNGGGFSGKLYSSRGSLWLNGAFGPATAYLVGGTIGGTGTVGPINPNAAGSYLNPGSGTNGILNSGNLSLGTADIFQTFFSPAGYNQLNVTGTVSLGNAALQLNGLGLGVTNSQLTIINNDGADAVTGTFAGLSEGATVYASNGAKFTISYHGGSGNDVVLTQVSLPTQPSLGGITKLGGGNMQLNGNGYTNLTYTVWANTNLITTNWITIGSAAAGYNGAIQFTDTNAPNYNQRFYRFSWP